MSESDRLIPPEILNDSFYDAIRFLAQYATLKHVLEIGSSAGAGSTRAFAMGLARNRGHPTLHCLEVSRARFRELEKAYANLAFVKCYNVSSVVSSRVASEKDVRDFYRSRETALNSYDLATVLGWREEGLRYLIGSEADRNGIAEIKIRLGIQAFDMVLIDGSEFTGNAELEDIYGSKIVCLDDTNAFKCFRCRQTLLADPTYRLLIDKQSLRNGFSIFCRTDAVDAESIARAVAIVARRARVRSFRRAALLPLRGGWRLLRRVRSRLGEARHGR